MKRILVFCLLAGALMTPARGATQFGCSWYLKTDADTLNVAFPDQSATYWSTELYAAPMTRVVIHGTYPFARYFSFHVYDAASRTVDSLADYQIEPDDGSVNPFRQIPSSPDQARTYSVTIEYSAKPAVRAPNTLYAGATADGAPNASGALIYRLYVPDDASSEAGNVRLPDVSIEGPGGSLAMGQCEPLPPSTGGALSGLEADSSFPDAVPRVVPLGNQYTNPPTTKRFYGADRLAWDRVPPNQATDQVPRFKGTFYSNDQNAYLITRTSRQFGDVVVYRLKAPTFPDTRAGVAVSSVHDLRYWSLCQYDIYTERYVRCLADYQSVIGEDGFARFVIADPSDRPSNATEANGINYLPWGGIYYDGFIGYRQMIPGPNFSTTVANVAEGQNGSSIMGAYWPQVRYCSKQTIEQSGYDACFG